ncbi:hypothetical protein Q8W71_04040 [Methylobacterium sp. NEAU 140]|uniref:hypothetical protein n=1 Tax=Methylobacterium sp. NEAU 140 TaxID=3064945 RepID=UPI002733F665|nr:hypothetical protein [Methylobacterium sp. NEAU 140]MDP4021787.1 hypothetical protein [Methylobacterium sp. NEAU 140]
MSGALAGYDAPRAPLALGRPAALAGALWNLEAAALFCYFTRDLTAGALRYYLTIFGLGPLWFIPDILAAACLAAFIGRHVIREGSAVALLTVLYTAFSLGIGLIVLGNVAAMASAFKMILPVFVGFCFCDRALGDYRRLLASIHAMFYVATFGVILSSLQEMPWVGFKYEAFGAVREAGRLWWAGDEGVRLSGLAADSTMAGFFVLITFGLAAPRRSTLWCLAAAPLAIYALVLTTSKTSLAVLVVYLAALLVVRALPREARFPVLRRLGLGSFLAIFIPAILVIVCSGIDLEGINPILFSMQDRINNSWQLPFVYMLRMAPTGYLIGCGLGCFNYPQELFAPKLANYNVPVDNFYLGTYLMFGVPSLIFVACAVRSLARSRDGYRYTLAFLLNLFTITVLSYGPASALLALGVVFSDVFSRKPHPLTDERGPPGPDAAEPARGAS